MVQKRQAKSKGKAETERSGVPDRQPPVHIPLTFEQAVEGLLGVKPEPKQPKKKAAKKGQPKD